MIYIYIGDIYQANTGIYSTGAGGCVRGATHAVPLTGSFFGRSVQQWASARYRWSVTAENVY